ncbi:3-oxoacyl-ACP reductase [Acetobacter nitrogenifigens DSM 23921 = NBRC 105050]|uniref:2-deoxy-D-gluconate 3-dehydrogenase n=1 Tax=Acetobacter nitrogenifigens DSM 23921 = NBRC 105050 TaxID=1120919 RepID=A0A511XBT3_9PROT|nr:glucose 1-dehydrogenase [Acetobacter nitrogenifigens]GBQ88424.1 3-oxoacyl-ACP reductase [Acetobacter nitrogenifigens DSM 23921 = NBRC 105050]GEN60400.1 2-deoxy-D-gluconate 3-dehydrogenase [Acetobacter nitrogenifigens DSM 23921 = NBRC 105050]
MNRDEPLLWQRFSLKDRCVLITGASRGIGRALALGFAQAECHVVIAARKIDSLAETAREISALGGSVEQIALDQTNVAGIRSAFAAIGQIDVLINNAGVEDVCPSLDIEEELWDRIIDTNLKGAFFVAQAAATRMAGRKRGAIINLASLTSYVGVPTATPYGSSKSGILGMTRALAAEWAPLGIRVNAIAPGYFHTDMTKEFYENSTWVESMQAKIPLGRFGAVDDLVGAAVFLSSDAASYITGQCLPVDGGYLASI